MIFLLPLGFMALIGLLVLLAIYLIKPSYQNKVIPSSYIWKESLKYGRKQIPASPLRNILIVLCQVLIIVLCALIIATPMLRLDTADTNEKIVIIDASADMRAEYNHVSRFGRAVGQAKTLAESSVRKGEKFTVILAGLKADYVVVQETSSAKINESLDALLENDSACSFGTGDIEGAMSLANEICKNNAMAQIYLYTGTEYMNTGEVNVVNVASENDWNSAVLSLNVESVENYYRFSAEVAVYGADKYVNVLFQADGVNDEMDIVRKTQRVNCSADRVQTVVFEGLGIYAYDSVRITLETDDGSQDSFPYDNDYVLYGGRKDVIKIQYASSLPNNFVNSALLVIQNACKDRYEIQITQPSSSSNFEVRGFDFYIFEHTMPSVMPSDGAVLLIDPDKMPPNADLELTEQKMGNFTMSEGVTHPITEFVDASRITATRYRGIGAGEEYDTLLTCEGEKVFVAKNTEDSKVAVLSLDLNYSNLSLLYEFPVMMSNLFDYFLPSTVSETVYDVAQTIEVDGRGHSLEISGDGYSLSVKDTPYAVSLSSPGSYTISQKLLSGKTAETKLFVKVPASESDFSAVKDMIPGLFSLEKKGFSYEDLLLYLSLALVVLFIAERILYSREKI